MKTKKINLGNGKIALIDADDYERVSAYKWHFNQNKISSGYAAANNKFRGHTTLMMHRLIMKAKRGQQVDHINGNGLDNRKMNLRICTQGVNTQKRLIGIGKRKRPYRGVFKVPKCIDRWEAVIRYKNKVHRLGTYGCPKKAAMSYNVAAKKFYGEHAAINKFPRRKPS